MAALGFHLAHGRRSLKVDIVSVECTSGLCVAMLPPFLDGTALAGSRSPRSASPALSWAHRARR
eukprot:4358608-Alexandrium_andersonii.AAC.1